MSSEFTSELLDTCHRVKAIKTFYQNKEHNRYFFDWHKLLLNPRAINYIADYLYEKARLAGAQGIGGRRPGAESLVTAIVMKSYAYGCDMPGFFIRLNKDNEPQKRYDGILYPNSNVVIVEPIATVGNNMQSVIDAVEHHKGTVKQIIVILERYEDGNEAYKIRTKGYNIIPMLRELSDYSIVPNNNF